MTINGTKKPNKLVGYVDAAYENDPKKRRSTTGYAFTYSGLAIVYRSKAQSIVALSSTEAELIAAVTAVKTSPSHQDGSSTNAMPGTLWDTAPNCIKIELGLLPIPSE